MYLDSVVKAQWGFPTLTIGLKLESVTKVVYVCFVLHNTSELNEGYVDLDLVEKQCDLHKQHKQHCVKNVKIWPRKSALFGLFSHCAETHKFTGPYILWKSTKRRRS